MNNSSIIKDAIEVSIGLIIGRILCYLIGGGDYRVLWMVMCAGLPAGWKFLSKYFGSVIFGGLPVMAVMLSLKFILSIMIGWIILLFRTVLLLIEVVKTILKKSAITDNVEQQM